MKMDSVAGSTASRAARITDRTLSMFRAILAENGIADTDDDTLEQEMVMFFKLSE
jgi:predicted HTH domain antitoxin